MIKHFHRKHALAYPNYSLRERGSIKALNNIAIVNECGGQTSLGGQERNILKPLQSVKYRNQAANTMTTWL